jgi:hypothetical protein
MDFSRLHLLSPLFYREAALPFGNPLDGLPDTSGALDFEEPFPETLFHFEITRSRAFAIDAGEDGYLGPLIAAGTIDGIKSSSGNSGNSGNSCNRDYLRRAALPPLYAKNPQYNRLLELPAGEYFFVQVRENLGAKEFVEMAVELQKEGLWERIPLGKTVYFRILWEDGAPVFQVLRPIEMHTRVS